jgi:serine-type D-Ala-D-Ala carboxypeptidase/endopeptidase
VATAPDNTGAPKQAIALGWLVLTDEKATVIWHNGGTGGYRTFLGFDPATRTGVGVLSNTSTAAGIDDIGQHLLIGTPLVEPPKARTEITLDPMAKQVLVGQYQLAPNFILTITFEGDQLFAQATGQPRFPIFAESPTQLFLKVVNAQMTFAMGPDGHAASMVLHQNRRDIPATRIK